MARKRHSAEQIMNKLRRVDVELSKGASVAQACRSIEVTEQTYYRWRRAYGGMKVDQAKKLKQLEKENARLKRLLADAELDQGDAAGCCRGKLLSPPRTREAVCAVRDRYNVSERRACKVLSQSRSVQRHTPMRRDDEDEVTNRIVELACVYGRDGTPRIGDRLHREGRVVNHKRVERIWREHGLKVPEKQPKRGRLWLNDGSCIRLRAERKDHVWAYDFVQDRTADGKVIRMLTVVDEFTRECLAIDVSRKLNSDDVLERLSWLFVTRGVPKHIRR